MILPCIATGRQLLNLTLVFGLASFIVGCTNMKKSAPMPAVPFDAMVIRHTVADYAKWRPAFDADKSFQEAAGLHVICVSRGLQNANDLEIPFAADSVEKAKAFGADPRLKEVMQKAGVTGTPNIKYVRVLRMSDTGKAGPLGKYVSVATTVADFDAWLKIFDREGSVARAKDGLTDVVLARGIDDPTLIFLVFKINSVEEANAALNTPARKALMQEAKVTGPLELYFGTDK